MNVGQSFYGYENWQYPSPTTSPHADTKSNLFAHNNNDWLDPTIPPEDLTQNRPPPSRNTSNHQTAVYKDELFMKSSHPGDPGPSNSAGPGASGITWPSSYASSQNQRGSQLRGSFLDQFNNATLDDPSNMVQNMSVAQMQTPPPTRDASSRRKPVKPQTRYATPSTTASRRKSTPASSWLKRATDQAPLDVSPLQFSPVEFSPANAAPFHSGGAATAPAQPQGSIFWDSNNNDEMDFSFPAIHEDPFATSLFDNDPPPFTQSSPVRPKATAAMTRQLRSNNKPLSDRTTRPHTARPATIAEASIHSDESFFPSSGVDPNMLWSSNLDSKERLTISEAAPRDGSHAGAPYQFHFEERKREKEDRLLRTSLQQRRVSHGNPALSHASQGLRRSVTDSKARRGHGSLASSATISGDVREITSSLQNAHIPREASPLKRQRTNQHPHPNSQAQTRKTVVLTVDEKGRAKTVVKPVQTGEASVDQMTLTSADASSQATSLPSSSSHSRQGSLMDEPAHDPADTPARSNAQEALWQMRRERQQRRKEHGGSMNSSERTGHSDPSIVRSQPLDGTDEGWGTSPTTISDPDLQALASSPANYPTRCVCGCEAANGWMIRCDSCKYWLHAPCLNFTSRQQIPSTYICSFCAQSTPASRNSRQR